MSVLAQIPSLTQQVEAEDIRDTLNEYGGLVTNDTTTFFSRVANINVWSRRKPIVDTLNPQPITMTTADMAEQLSDSGVVTSRYGIQLFGGAQEPKDYFSWVNLSGKGYIYSLPTLGAANQPMRMYDFCGYLPTAQVPLLTTFPDGYVFDYLQYDYPLEGIELNNSGNANDGQLYRSDIYPNLPNRGIYVRLEDGSYDFTVVGALKFKSEIFVRQALSKLAGKKFTIMEFLTNAPTTWSSFGVEDFVASGYMSYPLPLPISNCSMKASSGGGSAPTTKVAKVVFSNYPTFLALTTTDYSTVSASFRISSEGSLYIGGSITSISCGIYSDSACTNVIERRTFSNITLGSEATSSLYSVKLNNTTGKSGIYFGVWFNGSLQYVGSIKMQVSDSELETLKNTLK